MAAIALGAMGLATSASAGPERIGGKLPLTGGISTVEGSAGGGLATWALIAGDETEDGNGGAAQLTQVELPDFGLTVVSGSIGIRNRVELSVAHQIFNTRKAGAALGLGRSYTLGQDVFGVKVRVIGDAVWDQDKLLPQISVGLQHKRANRGALIRALGGKSSNGTDFYVSATKIVLPLSMLVNGTARWTNANQFGLLGFGGDIRSGRSLQFEGSAALLATPKMALGIEFRTKPDNLGFAREDASLDLFAVAAIGHHLTATAAFVDLGDIATFRRQRGLFVALQGSF
ncbi:DUF3034 family protein [Novosphingobium aquiterrae]|uniref:DUF3034 family protein n=1 Tax=Novosphingobium aquiterrae TaxID=624388 RepID=A0ABV6PGH3_9SPHN